MSKSMDRQATSKARWFSENSDKAWGEKFFLIYSPIWILQVVVTMVMGFSKTMGDIGLLILSCLVALPMIIVPLIIYPRKQTGLHWYQTYWFKADVYFLVFSVMGNYFICEYFFDVLGMVYNYPHIRLTFDAALVGSGEQSVPVIMYFLTMAYIMTYHTTAIVLLRRLKTSKLRGMVILFPIAVVVVSYLWAWMETFAMVNPLMQGIFYYHDVSRMLTFGSFLYAIYFITSFPIVYFIDEKPGKPWSLLQTIAGALSASMLTLFLLDLAAHFVGRL